MLETFIRYLTTERRYSPLTIRNYRRDIERFLAWLDDGAQEQGGGRADEDERQVGAEHDTCAFSFDLNRITTEDVREWIVWRSEQAKLSAASMNREVASLRAFFRYLRRSGRIEKDIFHGISSLKTSRRLPVFVPETRMKPLIDTCEETNDDFETDRNSLIVIMFYACGLRLAELVGVDRADFTDDYTSLRVRGKGDKERMVPILEFVREKILSHLDLIERQNICNSSQKALFLTRKGMRISRSVVYRVVRARLDGAGVQGKRSPHVLRHTFATHLLNDGADMREIQELMGHASLQATQVYTHNSIARLKEIYTKAHPREKGGK